MGGGEITQRMEETVDGRKYFKRPKKRSSKIYGAIGKKKPGGAANLGSAPGGRHPIYATGSWSVCHPERALNLPRPHKTNFVNRL